MAFVKICDGRAELYRYDTGVQLELCGCNDATECHFVTRSGVIRREVDRGLCEVPDAALLEPGLLVIYAFSRDSDSGVTRHEFRVNVEDRPKPADYIDPPDESDTLEAICERLKSMPELKGEPGPAGPAGEPGKDAEPYTLPTASETVKGGVKVGNGLQMTGDVLGVKPEGAWERIEFITVQEEGLKQIERNAFPDGTAYNLSAAKIMARFYYPLKAVYGTRVDFKRQNSEISSVVITLSSNSTSDNPAYCSTALYQAKPVSGLYEFTGASGQQGGSMAVILPPNGNFQSVTTDKKINSILFEIWTNNTIPVGTTIEIWGVRADA